MGARISEGAISALIFFVDPLGTRPHDADVNALIRIATLYEVPFATNQASADLLSLLTELVRERPRNPGQAGCALPDFTFDETGVQRHYSSNVRSLASLPVLVERTAAD